MINILHFGTFDVNNYGDLLFPLLAKEEFCGLSNNVLRAVSPIGGAPPGLSDCAPCIGALDLVQGAEDVDGALIGGGNIIHCMPSKQPPYVAAGRGSLGYGDLWIGPTCLLPEHVPIVWNAPGVPGPFEKAHHELVKTALKRTNYLSVRDELSRQYLLDVWSDADIAIAPDSAWAINRLWTREDLKFEYESLFSRLGIPVSDRTIVFHLNRRYLGGKGIRAIGKQLDSIAEQMSARPLLIAFAPCHGDDTLAREVAASMASHPVLIDRPQSLREIAACIAFSSAYAGSSMHGLITASAFGVPGVSVAKRSMAKFAGVLALVNQPDMVVEDWGQALDALRSMDFNRRKIDLLAVRDSAHQALEIHWNRIREELQGEVIKPKTVQTQLAWRLFLEYQNKAIDTLLEIRDDEHNRALKATELAHRTELTSLKVEYSKQKKVSEAGIKRLQAEYSKQKKVSEADIKRLQAQIKIIQRSYSWRLTKPLRAASQRFPHAGAAVIGTLRGLIPFGRGTVNTDSAPTLLPSERTVSAELLPSEWTVSADIGEKIRKYQISPNKGRRKIVFYTAVFGDYDTLLLPESIDEDIDYVCFTDRPRDTYGVWQMRASPYYHSDPTRIARYIKTHPHQLFPGYHFAIWLDANIVPRGDLQEYIDMLRLENTSFGLVPHPHRDCFYQEADACKLRRKDNPSVIDAQVDFYRKNGLGEYAGLFETGFMVIRMADEAVSLVFRTWWQEIEKFSRRDQMGLVWALSRSEIQVSHLLPKGVSVREDDDFVYYTHEECQQLRVPAQLLQLAQIKNPLDDVPFIEIKDERLSKVKEMTIDIVVCVYNALEDVQLCLEAALKYLIPGHKIIIVNDCSDQPTTEYLRDFAVGDERVSLIENEENLGYTQSANRGLAAGTASFRIMLNSDTIVCENWTLKMLDAAMQSPEIGVVGPLSNAAGVQSVPEIKGSYSNTAINAIPEGISYADIDRFLEKTSLANAIPEVPLVHGFCFGIKREVIDAIGLFDAVNFARYYGEENDYCFRAAAAGFRFAIATNTFVFHRKSRSIDEEERIVHMGLAGQRLRELYGVEAIKVACLQGEEHPLLKRMRAQVANLFL